MENTNYKHIVLFKIRDDVSNEDFEKALFLLQDLGNDNPDILKWVIKPSLDTRKGIIIIEDSLFINQEAFNKFRTSEKHAEAGAFMKEIADIWIIGDYEVD